MDYQGKLITFENEKEACAAFLDARASAGGARIMAPKAVFRIIFLKSVRNAVANILKQEMLAVGGDAAVSIHAVDCSEPTTDVYLLGTLQQHRRLLRKMRSQGIGIKGKNDYSHKFEEYFKLAEEIERVLKSAP